MLDPRTFGGSRAAEVLVERLKAHDSKMINKVGHIWVSYSQTFNEIKKLDSRISIGLAKLVYHNAIGKADTFPDDIKTYFKNIISARYRVFLIERDAHKPYKHRADYPAKQK
jgi:hypothetical protein